MVGIRMVGVMVVGVGGVGEGMGLVGVGGEILLDGIGFLALLLALLLVMQA